MRLVCRWFGETSSVLRILIRNCLSKWLNKKMEGQYSDGSQCQSLWGLAADGTGCESCHMAGCIRSAMLTECWLVRSLSLQGFVTGTRYCGRNLPTFWNCLTPASWGYRIELAGSSGMLLGCYQSTAADRNLQSEGVMKSGCNVLQTWAVQTWAIWFGSLKWLCHKALCSVTQFLLGILYDVQKNVWRPSLFICLWPNVSDRNVSQAVMKFTMRSLWKLTDRQVDSCASCECVCVSWVLQFLYESICDVYENGHSESQLYFSASVKILPLFSV
jgi:bacterioferritin-associated ferredoxin